MARIGLVAGEGELPIVFAKYAKKKGDTVIAIGLKSVTSEELANHVEKIHWFEWGDLKKATVLAVTERIRKVTMLGKIKKETFFKGTEKFDDEAKDVVKKAGGKKDYEILKGIANMLKVVGIEVIDPTPYLEELVPLKGVLTKSEPTKAEKEDIEYGSKVASDIAKFDIGQTVVVKDKTIIALEAAEGTDETIRRAGKLIGGKFTVVKMARPDQDARFDIPLIGLDTVKAIAESGGRVLAFQEKKTLLMHKEEVIKLADANNISIVVI